MADAGSVRVAVSVNLLRDHIHEFGHAVQSIAHRLSTIRHLQKERRAVSVEVVEQARTEIGEPSLEAMRKTVAALEGMQEPTLTQPIAEMTRLIEDASTILQSLSRAFSLLPTISETPAADSEVELRDLQDSADKLFKNLREMSRLWQSVAKRWRPEE